MLKKILSVASMVAIASALAACGGPAATPAVTDQPLPPAPTDAATAAPTDGAGEPTPEGGLGTNGGAPQAEVIAPENLDRLNTLYQLPLASFMTSMRFSPDSKLLAVGTAKGGAVFNLETQQQIATFADGTPLFGLAWSPDSKVVIGLPGAMSNGKLVAWDVTTNAESDYMKDSLADQTTVAFSPDTTMVATGNSAGEITLYPGDASVKFNVTEAGADASAGQPKVNSLAFSSDNKFLIVGVIGATEETLVWEIATNKALTKPTPANHVAGPIATALFAPGDMSHVYWWSRGDVVVVDLASDQETGRLTTEDIIQSAAFSPDGKLLAVGTAGAVSGAVSPLVKLWSTVTGQDVKVLSGLPQIPTAMAFSPDGSKLAFGFGGDGVAVWGLVQNQ